MPITKSQVRPWWETITFTHGPETEWFARSVFREACRTGKTIYWRCAPARGSVEHLDRLLAAAGCRLVLEHQDRPRTRRGTTQLHRVYVRKDGVAIVNREGATAVSLSIASTDRGLADRFDRWTKGRTVRERTMLPTASPTSS